MALERGTKVRITAPANQTGGDYYGKIGEVRQDNGVYATIAVKGSRGLRLLLLAPTQFKAVEG